MSQQNSNNKAKEEDDEIWNSLFGANNDKSQQRIGRTTLMTTKEKKNRASSKSRKKPKTESRSSSSRSSKSRSHNGSHSNRHKHSSHSSHSHSTNNNANSTEGPTTAERLSQFLCTPKTRARLPPPPLQCKFLKYPHKRDRFTKYCATNAELNYKWEMHHDSLFPLPLDLMDPDYYNPLKQHCDYDSDEQPLNMKEDERILQLLEAREYAQTAKEEQCIPEQEAFLLQTQYLTGGLEYELTESQRKGYDDDIMNDRQRRDRNRDKHRRDRDWDAYDEDNSYKRQKLAMASANPHSLENVQRSFEDIQIVLRHPKDESKEIAQMFDVFPHEGLCDNDYTHVQFDKDPIYQTKKCGFMSKYESERMKMAKLATQTALLRCVNREALDKERREEFEEMNMDLDMEMGSDKERDWFSLYGTNGVRRKSEYDNEEIVKYEWSAEFVPVQMDKKKKMHFMVIPKGGVQSDVYYASYENRLSLRHKQTDSTQDQSVVLGGKKGLSENDKRFFKQQPMNIKVNVPRNNDSY